MEDTNYNLEYLELQIEHLTKLVDINKIINSTLDIRKLLNIIMEMIKEIMDTDASTLLLLDDQNKDELVFKVALGEAGDELVEKYRVKVGQGIAGWVAETRESLIVNNVYEDKRFDPNFDKKTGFITKSIICTPLLFKGKLIGVIQAVNPLTKPLFDENDSNLFKAFANQASLAVQNAIFFKRALEEERLKNEVKAAGLVQNNLIADFNVQQNNFSLTGKTRSVREVGGEFHSIYKISDAKFILVIGDIHEKGVAGALDSSYVNGIIRALVKEIGEYPLNLVKRLYSVLPEKFLVKDKFSIFYGIVDIDEMSINFVNTGMIYPILIRDTVSRYLRFQSSVIDGENSLRKIRVNLRSEDFFAILSDGLLNFKNRNSHLFGLNEIMKLLNRNFENSDEIVNLLIENATFFASDGGKTDDFSIITLSV